MASLIIFLAVFAAFTAVPSMSVGDLLQIDPPYNTYFLKFGVQRELHCSGNTTVKNARLSWTWPENAKVVQRMEVTSSTSSVTTVLRSSLLVDNFSTMDVGDYTCSLVSEKNTLKTEKISLQPVEEKKSEPVFERDKKVAILSCVIKYENITSMIVKNWQKDGVEIVDDDKFDVGTGNHTLIINNPIRQDAGVYVAEFEIASKEHPYDCEVSFNAGPLVLDFEKSKNIIEGEDLELECVVKGYPYAVVTWYKDKRVLNDSHVILTDLNGHHNAHLMIRDAEFHDAGNYSCEAFSAMFPNDTSSKSITVRVKDKLAALWPFLGIVGEVVLLCTIIVIYEKRRSKEVQQEDNAARDLDGATVDRKEGLRHRNTNNPTA